MRVCFDSSAFAKCYVAEAGSQQVLDWCDRAHEIVLSAIALPELISAFCRLHREGKITPFQYTALKRQLLEDAEDIVIADLSAQVLAHAITHLEDSPLKGMDAIHIGSAVALHAEAFITADAQQASAARKAGLKVVRV